MAAKAFVESFLPKDSTQTLRTQKDGKGKFGRILGKFLVYDPTYIHGILPGSDKQITLWYNVWSYKPDNLERVGVSRPIIERPTYKMKKIKEPVLYLGKTVSLGMDVHQRPITLKGPHGVQSMGSLWNVSQ